jgi:RNA polymerase sigma factor (sigma-70 family)
VRKPQSYAIDEVTCLATLLLGWQASGDERLLEPLIAASRPLIQKVAAGTLHRHGIDDPAAGDDVISRVFDHLRRLPGALAGERFVAEFAARNADDVDDGLAYIVWLTRSRAVDVVRSRRRLHRHERCFSALTQDATRRLASCVGNGGVQGPDEETLAACRLLREAIPLLEPRQRAVIELLLAGKSQTVIAHVLDVCEGTVSRLRSKAIESLRRLLAE